MTESESARLAERLAVVEAQLSHLRRTLDVLAEELKHANEKRSAISDQLIVLTEQIKNIRQPYGMPAVATIGTFSAAFIYGVIEFFKSVASR